MFITLESFLGVCEVGEEFWEELALPVWAVFCLVFINVVYMVITWFQISTVIICS